MMKILKRFKKGKKQNVNRKLGDKAKAEQERKSFVDAQILLARARSNAVVYGMRDKC